MIVILFFFSLRKKDLLVTKVSNLAFALGIKGVPIVTLMQLKTQIAIKENESRAKLSMVAVKFIE